MAYGDHDGTPRVGQTVTYVLSQEEYNRYQVASVSATIFAVHSALSVDLVAAVNVPAGIAKSANITGFSIASNVVTLSPLNVSYDSSGYSKRAWYVALGAPLPTGSPW